MQKFKVQQKLTKYTSLIFLFVVCCFQTLQAQDYLPEKPKIQTSIYDYAQLLDGLQLKALEQKLINYNDTTSTQIVVVTVKSLNGQDIAMYGTELAHKWGIGQAGKDNGILLLVSKDDRKMTIRTGYGVESKLTDAMSRRIIENVITPRFKLGDYYDGLDKGTSAIIQVMNGEFQGEPEYSVEGEEIPFYFYIILFIILMMIFSRRSRGGGKNGGRKGGGFSLLDAIILSNAGRGSFSGGGFGSRGGGFGGGSFGGGGFSGGFGGGGFGGGGASGGW